MLARLKNKAHWLVAIVASALVFGAYTRPDFIVTMANQVWLCF